MVDPHTTGLFGCERSLCVVVLALSLEGRGNGSVVSVSQRRNSGSF